MSDRLHVGTRKGLFTYSRRAGRWSVERVGFLGDTVGLVHCDGRDHMLYASLELGHFGNKLRRSPDQGATFEDCGVPEYPPKPEGLVDLNPMQQKPIEWKLDKIWSLQSGNADQPGALWAGTIPGGLFVSNNHGTSWQIVSTLWNHPSRQKWFGGGAEKPGIHSVLVDPGNSRRITIGVSCGGVWHSDDGGETFRVTGNGIRAEYMPPEQALDPEIQDPHQVVQCRARPECFWVQHHNGIFKSTDGGASWQEIKDVKPSVFGFAVAVHPRDPDTAWFIPAVKDEKRYPFDGKVVVTRTRDGGKSFEILTKGLPQEHAYDLVYRHGLDIDAIGQRLVFGSTTGALFVSENQGDSWECLSSHLPPIYCVRFAV